MAATGELFVSAFTAIIERLIDHLAPKTTEEDSSGSSQRNDDFAAHDPEDMIFQEFEGPRSKYADPLAWKTNMPSLTTSLMRSAWFSFRITILVGGFVGLGALVFMFCLMETVSKCHWKSLDNSTYPLELKRVYLVGASIMSYFLYFWHPLLLIMVFKWSVIKDSNLLTCAAFGASIDLAYRSFCAIYDLHQPLWFRYPLNVLYLSVVLVTSFAIGRKVLKNSSFYATILAFKLCAQFMTFLPLLYFLFYVVFPWFAQQEGTLKLAVPLFAALSFLPSRLITRLCVIQLDGINHPGTSHVLISVLICAFAMVNRIMQAEFKVLPIFLALGIGHGLVMLGYELTTTLRHRSWENLWTLFCAKAEDPDSMEMSRVHVSHVGHVTPRSQRLAADMAIQGMMFDSTALVVSVGVIQVYGLIYVNTANLTSEKGRKSITDLLARIFLGLFIEFFFNTISILIHTRCKNVPILRVWNLKWKSHLKVCILTAFMVITYGVNHVLVLIRARYAAEEKLPDDCTMPFQ